MLSVLHASRQLNEIQANAELAKAKSDELALSPPTMFFTDGRNKMKQSGVMGIQPSDIV